jgi:hypothetical protein
MHIGKEYHRSRCCHEQAFQEGCVIATEASPSHCRRTEAIVYADEKEVGGKKEKEFVSS